jgi:hypothetical protein
MLRGKQPGGNYATITQWVFGGVENKRIKHIRVLSKVRYKQTELLPVASPRKAKNGFTPVDAAHRAKLYRDSISV